jgi:alpha-2-macroglobulin
LLIRTDHEGTMRSLSILIATLFIHTAVLADEVRKELELWVDWTELQSEQETPRYCINFNLPLLNDGSIAMDAFVRVEPGDDAGISVRRNILCIDGLHHSENYTVTLLDGLPGAQARLDGDSTFDINVPSRSPIVAFPSGGYVLPAQDNASIPIETINVDTLALNIYRVNDRALAQELRDGMVFGTLYDWTMEQLGDQDGELVWQGELDIEGEQEQRVRTAIPIAETIGTLEPGIYAAAAVEVSALEEEYYWYDWATQWFIVSDLGLAAMVGDTGLHATVRSLSGGQALDGVTFELIARNSKVLATVTSDSNGLAVFDPGLVRGAGGNAPRVLIARAGDDFAFIDLDSAPIDLSDRGVDGREPAGPLDAFLYSDRGIYRPGESVHIVTLLRDAEAMAQDGVPVTLRLLRPDGVETLRATVYDSGAGSYPWTIVLPGNAYTGSWAVQALVGDDNVVGDVRFLVEDFVPPRIEFDLAADPEIMVPANNAAFATVEAGYLYGGVAAGLEGEATFSFALSRNPFDRNDGFEFGLAEEDSPASSYDTAYFTTDDTGFAEFQLALETLESITSPVEVTVHAQIFDVGGRPVGRNATMDVLGADTLIGIKPLFPENTVDWQEEAAFEIGAFDVHGDRIALDGLRW